MVSNPSMSGIMMSINTISMFPFKVQLLDCFPPALGRYHFIPWCSSTLVIAKMFRISSSTISAVLPRKYIVVLVQRTKNLLLGGRQLGKRPVQVEGHLINQPLGRHHALTRSVCAAFSSCRSASASSGCGM